MATPYPPRKKTSPWVWILLGVGAFALVVSALLVAGGVFVYYKAKQAGIDPDLMRRDPALAVAKMVTAVNPDVEVVSYDEKNKVITVREKKTGKEYRIDFEDAQRGKIVLESDQGTMTVGGRSRPPGWLPQYPGADPEAVFVNRGEGSEQGSFHFTTADSASQVTRFFEVKLKEEGFTVKPDGATLRAVNDSMGREVMVVVTSGDEGTTVNLTFQERAPR